MLPIRIARQGMNNSIISAALWSFFSSATTGPVLAGLMLALHLSNFQIGLVMSMTLLFLPFQIFGAVIQQRYFNRKKFWTIMTFLYYFSYFVLAALAAFWAQLPAALAVPLFLGIFALAQAAVQTAASVFLAWMGELVPSRESNSFWNRRQGWVQVTILISSIGAGLLVDALGRDSRSTYVVVLAAGTIFGLLSLWVQIKAEDPDPMSHSRSPLLAKARKTWRNERFRQLIMFFGFQSLVAWLACPFIFVYLQKSVNLSMTTVQLLVALSSLVSFLSGYLFRVIGNKYGRKPVLMLCTFLKGIEFIFWGTLLPENGWIGALPCFILGGFVNMGIGASQLSLLTSVESKRNQSFSIGVFFAVNGLCGFLSSSVSGKIYDWLEVWQPAAVWHLTSFNLLALVVALGYFVSLLLLWTFREDGAAPTGRVVKVLLSNNPFRSIYHAHVLSQPMEEKNRIEMLDKASGNLIATELAHDLYSPSSRVRESAVWNIARSEGELGPALEAELIKIMDMPELGLQAAAARALGRLHSVAAVPVLVKYLQDGDLTLAQSCIFALGMIGDTVAVVELDAILGRERRQALWPAAAEALGQLGGHRHTRRIYNAYIGECNWVLRTQLLIAVTRTVCVDKIAVHSTFEAEERQPGSEIERILKALRVRIEENSALFRHAAAAEQALIDYDGAAYAVCLERIMLPALESLGVVPDDKTLSSSAFLSSLFVSAGNVRGAALNADTPAAAAVWLMLNLWAEMKYAPGEFDRNRLTAALLAADSVLIRCGGGNASTV